MIDQNTKARAIAELTTAAAEAVSDVANVLSESTFLHLVKEKGVVPSVINHAVGAMIYAEAELARVLELIRAAKALQQMSVAS